MPIHLLKNRTLYKIKENTTNHRKNVTIVKIHITKDALSENYRPTKEKTGSTRLQMGDAGERWQVRGEWELELGGKG